MPGIQRVRPNLRRVLAVLLTAHTQGEKLHGYAVMQRSGETDGTVYPMLKRLVDGGLLQSAWEDSATTGTRSRRVYWLTSSGVAAAQRHAPEPDERLRRKGGSS
jgi:DNA-binding PadR family transcriptional regulator